MLCAFGVTGREVVRLLRSNGWQLDLVRDSHCISTEGSKTVSVPGIAYQTCQRIEDPDRSNPTLKTILKLEKVLEHRLVHVD